MTDYFMLCTIYSDSFAVIFVNLCCMSVKLTADHSRVPFILRLCNMIRAQARRIARPTQYLVASIISLYKDQEAQQRNVMLNFIVTQFFVSTVVDALHRLP